MRKTLFILLAALVATSAAAQTKPRKAPAKPAAKTAPAPTPPPVMFPNLPPPPPPANAPICDALNRTVELNLKALSGDYADSTTARAAAQAAQVSSQTANDLAVLNMNLGLMNANSCKPFGRPVGLMNYSEAALACAQAAPADRAAKCDKAEWKASF